MKTIKATLVIFVLSLIAPSAFAMNPDPGGRNRGGDSSGGQSPRPGGHIHFKGCGHDAPPPQTVPEMNPGSIGIAIAMIGGLLAFAGERRKKL